MKINEIFNAIKALFTSSKIVKSIGFIFLAISILSIILTIKISVITTTKFNHSAFAIFLLTQILLLLTSYLFVRKTSATIKLLPSILLSTTTTILCIALLEFFLKLQKPHEIGTEISTTFHHMYKANDFGYRYPLSSDEFPKIEIQTNNYGMRGPNIQPKGNSKRILILGDSFIQADEIDYKNTVGSQLQLMLNPNDFLIMQQGYSSWSPLLELNFLNKRYSDLQPDHVYLVLFINDFYDADVYPTSDSGYTKETTFDSSQLPSSFKMTPASYFKSILEKSSIATGLLPLFKQRTCNVVIDQTYLDALISQENYSKNDAMIGLDNLALLENSIRLARPYEKWDRSTTETVNLSLNYIKQISEIVKKRSGTLTILLTPSGWNIASDESVLGKSSYPYCLHPQTIIPLDGLNSKLMEFSRNEAIDFIDLPKEMTVIKRTNSENLFLKADGHWTTEAHKIMSVLLFDDIMNKD